MHPVPVLVAHLEHRLVARDAGVVDEDVEPPVLRRCTSSIARWQSSTDAHVALVDRHRRAAEPSSSSQELLGLLLVATCSPRRRPRPARGEAAADRCADAAVAAGDERHASLELAPSPCPRSARRLCGRGQLLPLVDAARSARERALEPLRDVRPDLVARLRPGHEADVAARAVEVRDVLARHEVEQRQRARRAARCGPRRP